MLKKGRGIAASWYGTGYGNGFPDVSIATIELKKMGMLSLELGHPKLGKVPKQLCLKLVQKC